MPTAALLALATLTPLATADLTPIQESRFYALNVAVEGDTGGDQNQIEGFASDTVFNPFDPWSGSDSIQTLGGFSGIGEAQASVESAISATSITGSATVSSRGESFDDTISYAEGTAQAQVQVAFSLSQASTWNLAADLATSGVGTASIVLSQGATPGGAEVFAITTGSVDQNLALAAGDYTLTMSVVSFAVVFISNTGAEGAASFGGSFTLVPAPAGALLLGSVGILASRRRRA